MAITDTWLKAQHKKEHEKGFEKADSDGLSVRVSAAGKVVFQMRYRHGGKPARLDLGTYPLLSLKEARTEHSRLKALLEQGHDPRVVKAVERRSIEEAPTNEQLYREWHEAYAVKTKSQAGDYLRSFEIHVFPELGHLPADQTTTHQWMTLVERVADRTPSIAERILQTAKQQQKWSHRRGRMTARPLADVSVAEDLRIEREESGRALSDDDIWLFWHATESSRMTPSNKLFLKLCLFFGCRNGELRNADPVEDLDFGSMLWTVPPEKNKIRRKVRRGIYRPIIDEVKPLLEEAMRQSLSPRVLFSQASKPVPLQSSDVLCLPYSVMRNAKRRFGVEMEHWSMHDLRKTARTNFSTLTDVHVAELMLGHSLQGMQGVYDRHLYQAEQREAYRAWWARLQSIVSRGR